MKVEPKTEKQVQEMNLRSPGEYDFLVVSAEDKLSSKGNEMAVVKLQMEDSEGRNFTITDYLVSIDSMAYKVRHFAESVGLLAEYEKGDLPATYMEGRTGKCKVGVKPAEGQYSAKNIVTDYIGTGATEAPAKQLEDDEIPF
jgi:hypothetical protein